METYNVTDYITIATENGKIRLRDLLRNSGNRIVAYAAPDQKTPIEFYRVNHFPGRVERATGEEYFYTCKYSEGPTVYDPEGVINYDFTLKVTFEYTLKSKESFFVEILGMKFAVMESDVLPLYKFELIEDNSRDAVKK